MLILSRKPRETIFLGQHVKITIVDIRGQTVRVGIEAPDSLAILRGELVPENGTVARMTRKEPMQ